MTLCRRELTCTRISNSHWTQHQHSDSLLWFPCYPPRWTPRCPHGHGSSAGPSPCSSLHATPTGELSGPWRRLAAGKTSCLQKGEHRKQFSTKILQCSETKELRFLWLLRKMLKRQKTSYSHLWRKASYGKKGRFFKNTIGTSLLVQCVKTLQFHCRECRFDPWSGN